MSASFDEPTIPLRLQRPLAATWISLGLHAALIALVQVAPPAATTLGGTVIEARLVPAHAMSSEVDAPEPLPGDMPLLASTETAEAVPVVQPVAPPPARTLPGPAATQSVPSATVEAPAAPASPVTITSSVDLTYYSAREVDVHPRALRAIEPDYPVEADRNKLSGTVRLQLKIEADGRVSDVEVVSANPPGVFDASAVKAFRDARFVPAQKNGRPVRVQVLVPVEFDWTGRAEQLGSGVLGR